MNDRTAMDEVYVGSLPTPLPARTCFAVGELTVLRTIPLYESAQRNPGDQNHRPGDQYRLRDQQGLRVRKQPVHRRWHREDGGEMVTQEP